MQPTPLLLPSTGQSVQDALQGADEQLGALGHGLRRRLLAMLLFPLCLLALVNMAVDYRVAGGAAAQQDSNLQRLAPLLADSLVAWNVRDAQSGLRDPVILMAPPVEEFLKDRGGLSAYRLSDAQGKFISGDEWIDPVRPGSDEPELNSTVREGVTYRIVTLRAQSRVGEVIAQIADGSDARQQWWRAIVFKVLVPNLILVVAAFFVVRWAVARALAPLMALTRAVEHRTPSDLQPIDPLLSPVEVRPLVVALNRLFGTVDAQVQGQQRFVADAAHQLRTPLTGLQSQVEAWAQQAQKNAQLLQLPIEDVYKLRDATRRTTDLANQLLVLSRVDAQVARSQPAEMVDLRLLAEDVLQEQLDAATAKQVDLGLDVQDARTHGYAWLLHEALTNLVDNAIKYTPPWGHVTIRCAQDADASWLEVQDSGPGIAPGERSYVVQRFYRSPGTQVSGNGLGLAIVAEIARLHGATLWLEDPEMGQGLRVRLVFSVRESAQ